MTSSKNSMPKFSFQIVQTIEVIAENKMEALSLLPEYSFLPEVKVYELNKARTEQEIG